MKKCKACRKEFSPFNSLQKACSPKCALELGRKDLEKKAKAEQKAQKAQRAKDKKRKNELKTKREWTKDCQVVFNRYIRLRDKDLPCISCGKFTNDSDLVRGSRWDCGHYLSVGAHIELRFEELNCHRQCVKCNRNLSGNVARYRMGLIERIGLEKVEWLDGKHELKRYSIEDLKDKISYYKAKIKEIENNI